MTDDNGLQWNKDEMDRLHDEELRGIYREAFEAERNPVYGGAWDEDAHATGRRAVFEAGRSAGRSDGITVPRETRAESLAQQFHDLYEALAPTFGYETRKASAVSWDQVPEQNRRLMIAVCGALLSRWDEKEKEND